MIVYLASPNSQVQAAALVDRPVLLSYASYASWLDKYQHTFGRLLIDSGAFSEFTSGAKIDVGEYADWAARWIGHADAIAGLDDIGGDWRRSLKNYQQFTVGFPTIHDTDPPELLSDLIAISRERGNWIGIGLKPPRHAKEKWVRSICDKIPGDIHVHGWALRLYTDVRRLDTVDSTNWWRDAMKLRTLSMLDHLTYAECLDIIVKRYVRWQRQIKDVVQEPSLFDRLDGSNCAPLPITE